MLHGGLHLLPQGRPRSCELTLNEPLRHLFASSMSLVAMVDVGDLRWSLFTKKQLEAQKLPPTRGALHEAIARAHYQAMV